MVFYHEVYTGHAKHARAMAMLHDGEVSSYDINGDEMFVVKFISQYTRQDIIDLISERGFYFEDIISVDITYQW